MSPKASKAVLPKIYYPKSRNLSKLSSPLKATKKPTSMSSPIRPVITAKSCTARSMPSLQAVLKSVTWLGHAPKKMSHLPRPSGVVATVKMHLLKPNKAKPSTYLTATTLSSSIWHWGIHSVSVARRSLPHQVCKSAATSLLMS